MLNSKINLFGQDWIDTIFQGRNKEYGAYELRQQESRITVKALIIGSLIFVLLISAPLLIKHIGIREDSRQAIDEQVTLVDLLPPPETPKDAFVPPPPPVREMQSIKEIKKFTPPVVAPEQEVVEELVSQEELKKADAGARDVDATEDGEVVIDERPVEHKVEKQIIEDNTIRDFRSVQVQPSFPGGIQKFHEHIMRNLGSITIPDNQNLRLVFQFVIEKDGSLTDIKVLEDGGQPGIAQRAISVLQNSPKWSPGVNNGIPVRVSFKVPIVVRIQN